MSSNTTQWDILDKPLKRAFLLAVSAYLKQLNKFASSQKDPNLIEYNVGGVIGIVEQLDTLASTYKLPEEDGITKRKEEELLKLLLESWFQYRQIEDPQQQVVQKKFFAQEFDLSGTLPSTVGTFLLSLQKEINTLKFEMFRVSSNLLRQYSEHIQGDTAVESSYPGHLNDVCLRTKDSEQLIKFFSIGLQLQEIKFESNLSKIETLRHEGNNELKQNKYGAAIAKYTDALNLDSTNHILYANRAAAFTYLNDIDSAIQDLKISTELYPTYETAWTRLAYCYLVKGDAANSIKCYVKAIGLAEDGNALPQYIKKLYTGLRHAVERARSRGLSTQLITSLTEPVQAHRTTYASDTDGSQSSNVPSQGITAGQGSVPNQGSVSVSGSIQTGNNPPRTFNFFNSTGSMFGPRPTSQENGSTSTNETHPLPQQSIPNNASNGSNHNSSSSEQLNNAENSGQNHTTSGIPQVPAPVRDAIQDAFRGAIMNIPALRNFEPMIRQAMGNPQQGNQQQQGNATSTFQVTSQTQFPNQTSASQSNTQTPNAETSNPLGEHDDIIHDHNLDLD